jgi:hypothetical protein
MSDVLKREDKMEALEWCRTEVSPAMRVTAFAQMLGIPRTTYDSYKRGSAEAPEWVLIRAGERRGLPQNWYKGRRYLLDLPGSEIPNRPKTFYSASPVPTVATPSIGLNTGGALTDLTLRRSSEPIELPANMSGPGHVVAIADQNDTGPEFPHGWQLIFHVDGAGKIGKRVHVTLPDGSGSLRVIEWDQDRRQIVYRSLVGKPDLTKDECSEDGLLVGYVAVNKPGKFLGAYDEEGI